MTETLPDRVQTKLTELQKTARGASLEAGLSEAFVLNILRGKSKSPRGENLARLASVLGVSEAWLLHGGEGAFREIADLLI